MTTRRKSVAVLLAVGAAATLVPAPAALAWWRGGVFFGFPPILPYFYAPPPVVYAPPPIVYAPPPGYGAPPPGYYGAPPPPPAGSGAPPRRSAGPACHAGAYVCPLETPAPAGSPCSCPTNTGRAAGRVG